jgi:DNA polymerase type B, organellar and viral
MYGNNMRTNPEAIERNRLSQRERNKKRLASTPHNYDFRRNELEKRRFIGWDGEGYNAYVVSGDGSITIQHRYMLFGNSDHYALVKIELGTKECLDLMLWSEEQNPDAFNVGFAFDYDVNMIFRDLSWSHLNQIKVTGRTVWKGYTIEHIPHKIFTVKRNRVSITIYDVYGFFHSSYVNALEKYHVGDPLRLDIIIQGKKHRGTFTWAERHYVTKYWKAEISLFPELMDSTRQSLYDGGFFITQWHGPGAVAKYALRQHNYESFKSDESLVPVDVKIARQAAYAGGRFQPFKCGLYLGIVYTADINSAYLFALAGLPNLRTGRWVHRGRLDSTDSVASFGLYYIRWNHKGITKENAARIIQRIPMPLFHRSKSGQLTWPAQTENWYWSPEAELVIKSDNAEILDSWEYAHTDEKPYAWVADAYATRLSLKRAGHRAEFAYKHLLASLYGQLARRVGWNQNTNSAPPTHQLELAGFITSWCRAAVGYAALHPAKNDSLISIDTDSVTSLTPFIEEKLVNGIGEELGQWKLEQYSGIMYWQNGVYWLRNDDGDWIASKTRGIKKNKIPIEKVFEAYERSNGFTIPNESFIEVEQTRFRGYNLCISQGNFEEWRTWNTESRRLLFGGAGKSIHVPSFCLRCRETRNESSKKKSTNRSAKELARETEGMHDITPLQTGESISQPHKLPWLEEKQSIGGIKQLTIFEDDSI